MKKLLLLLSVVLTLSSPTLQSQTIEAEAAMNAKLRENSILAAEQKAKLEGDKPISVINHLSGNVNTAASANLTDQDKQLSENFIHQGKANRVIQENCAGDMATICSGGEGKHKFMGMDPGMMKAVGQAYATIGAMGGDSFLALSPGKNAGDKKPEGAAETPKDGAAKKPNDGESAKKEKAEDYCKYIPTVTEGIATFTQMNMSKDLMAQTSTSDSAQRDALLKAAKSHDGRAKQAQMQAMGWYGGAACYAGMAAYGSFAIDKNLIIKIGAATLLGTFYQSEVAANKDYADKTRKIAEQMPGKGDCNPITDKLCYCAQPETQNDPQYCQVDLHNKALAMDSYRVACTDENMKIDPSCSCEARNACFDSFLAAKTQGALDVGSATATSPFKSIRSFSRGELIGGTLNSQAYARTAAIAKKALNELGSRFPSSGPLSPSQKIVADALLRNGIPANVANLMAQNPPPQSAVDAAMGKVSGSGNGILAMAAPGSRNSNIVDFSGGNGLGTSGNVPKKNEDDFASKLLGGKPAVNSKILQFAQRAEAQAAKTGQIRREDDRPLFEIISMRYQLTGRKLLQVEGE